MGWTPNNGYLPSMQCLHLTCVDHPYKHDFMNSLQALQRHISHDADCLGIAEQIKPFERHASASETAVTMHWVIRLGNLTHF